MYLENLSSKHKAVLKDLKSGNLTEKVISTLEKVAKETSKLFE